MKHFCFTVDDNIRFLKEITKGCYGSIFEHPYLAMYRRLHEAFGLRVQLNLFFRDEEFDLSAMTEVYRDEWAENSEWLKLSFHSERENVKPYENSPYDEVFEDCRCVHAEIRRFATDQALAKTTTIHYCLLTPGGLKAVAEQGVSGLLGLFGTSENPRTSYSLAEEEAQNIREGNMVEVGDITFASIDIILNCFSKEEILSQLVSMTHRDCVRVMIHEQYFYPDYHHYQADFEEKLRATFSFLTESGYQSEFFENLIN